jgi:hypothetical protein
LTADGCHCWVIFQITGGTIRGQVLQIPAGVRRWVVADQYYLYDSENVLIGALKIRDQAMFGFSSFLMRLGGEVGDYLRITFNLTMPKANVEMSTEPFEI